MIGDRHVTAVHIDLPDSLSLWTLQVRTARSLLDDGRLELAETPAMVAALFEAIGVGQWFRYVTGIIKVASANALLVTAPRADDAWRNRHASLHRGGSPAMPLALLIGSLAVLWGGALNCLPRSPEFSDAVAIVTGCRSRRRWAAASTSTSLIAWPGNVRSGGTVRTAAALTQIAERLTPERRELYGQAFETFAATLNHMQGSGLNRRGRYRSGSGYQIIARLFL
jgi:putative oxidoreductase